MVNCIVMPYKNYLEKVRIFKENTNIKFMDLGNCLMKLEDIGQDEPTVGKLCWMEKR